MLDAANFLYKHALGPIHGFITARGIQVLQLPHPERPPEGVYLLHSTPNLTLGRILAARLENYFAGSAEDFEGLPLDYGSVTDFQREVWEAARDVAWGEILTYGELAKRVGRSAGSARAVGHALGANPLAILVPCHRFIAANGDLVDFAAGLEWKRELLRLEGSLIC